MSMFEPLSKIILFALLALSSTCAATAAQFEGSPSTWHEGFARFDYLMDDGTFAITPFNKPDGEKFNVGTPPKGQRRLIVVAPKNPARGNPWSWQGCYWDHEPQTEVELLRRGFHIAFITPDPGPQWDAFYKWLTEEHGFSKKPSFVGMSKGGVNEYDWATANPDKVSSIYADNPAIRPEAFAKLDLLAKNDVALINVCGSHDFLLQRHTLPIEARYQQLGGRIAVMIKDGPAHHPHSIKNPKVIADFLEQHQLPTEDKTNPNLPGATFTKSYYYSLQSTNVFLKEEKTFANCRGPGFTECFARYDAPAKSQWGLATFAIIAPNKIAEGKPWVFRADNITRDAVIDQALLAKGYHIVIAPLTEQSGPVLKQWEETYKLLTENGFSKKPILEGSGSGAGDAYAWAIAHNDQVSCVVGQNPALRTLMTTNQPMQSLEALYTARIPALHICNDLDPWYDQYTRPVEKQFKENNGEFLVVVNEAEGAAPLTKKARQQALEFILAHTSK